MTFNSLNLTPELLKAIEDQGYTQTTPIQERVIPEVLGGQDIMAAAQTGTGKTAGFTLPVLQILNQAASVTRPRCLVLAPTRELAAQVADSFTNYGKYLPISACVIFGGVKIQPQIRALKQGIDVVIATPGRLLDHVQQKTIDLSKIEIFVLDEADRMLDMGFIKDIRKIIKLLPPKRQNLLFSATFNGEIKELAQTFLTDPVSISVSPPNATASSVEQVAHPVEREQKQNLLVEILNRQKQEQTLVFTRSKHGADRLARQLAKRGFKTAAIHGGKAQNARNKALSGFKNGDYSVLVATDIAARGLDISDLNHVVNFDLPQVPEDYVHRIGRTGRAGRSGLAISLVTVADKKLLASIEKFTGKKLQLEQIENYKFGLKELEPNTKNTSGRTHNKPNRNAKDFKRRSNPNKPKAEQANTARPKRDERTNNKTEPRRKPKQRDSHKSKEGRAARNPNNKGKVREISNLQQETRSPNAKRFVVSEANVRTAFITRHK